MIVPLFLLLVHTALYTISTNETVQLLNIIGIIINVVHILFRAYLGDYS